MAQAGATATVHDGTPAVEGLGAERAARPPPPHGAHPGVRDRGRQAAGGRAAAGLPAPVRRAGGGRGRRDGDAHRRRPDHLHPPRPRARGGQGRATSGRCSPSCSGASTATAVAAAAACTSTTCRSACSGANGIVGGRAADRRRRRLRELVPRRRRHRDDLLRRRRQQHRDLPRGGQHGGGPQAPDRLRLREQRLRRVHAAGPAHAARRTWPTGRRRTACRARSATAWTPSPSSRPAGGPPTGPGPARGPTLVEAKTYRYYDHQGVKGLRIPYRTQEEIDAWKKRDAIELLEARALADGVLDQAAFDQVWEQTRADAADAIAFAKASPMPDPADVLLNVYSD